MTMPFTEDTLVQQTTAEYLRDELGWEAADCFHEIECACVRAGVVDEKDLAVVKKEICWRLV